MSGNTEMVATKNGSSRLPLQIERDGVDKERRRVIEIVDTMQELVLKRIVLDPKTEDDRHHNAMIHWFSGLVDSVMEKITKTKEGE